MAPPSILSGPIFFFSVQMSELYSFQLAVQCNAVLCHSKLCNLLAICFWSCCGSKLKLKLVKVKISQSCFRDDNVGNLMKRNQSTCTCTRNTMRCDAPVKCDACYLAPKSLRKKCSNEKREKEEIMKVWGQRKLGMPWAGRRSDIYWVNIWVLNAYQLRERTNERTSEGYFSGGLLLWQVLGSQQMAKTYGRANYSWAEPARRSGLSCSICQNSWIHGSQQCDQYYSSPPSSFIDWTELDQTGQRQTWQSSFHVHARWGD